MSEAGIWDLEYRFGAWLRFQGVKSVLGGLGVLVPGPKAEIKPRRTHGAQAEGHVGGARRAARATGHMGGCGLRAQHGQAPQRAASAAVCQAGSYRVRELKKSEPILPFKRGI